MASKLLTAFREQMESGKDGYKHKEAIGDISYSTGFSSIDYINGYMVHVKNDKEDYYYPQLGLPDGKSIMAIGFSAVGKSTMLIQMAGNLVRGFDNGTIYHADLEGGTNDHRIEVLTKYSQSTLRDMYHYQDTGVTSETFYEQIKWIHDNKLSNKSDFEYDTGIVNFRGDPIFKLQPTCYIIDSLPMLLPDDVLEEDKVSGQMSTTSSVKMNTYVFRKIQQLCKEANIILMSVNHILEDVQINMFAKKKASIAGGGLKQGERLPGGRSIQYLGNTIIRLDAASKLKEDEGFGINGLVVNVQTVKTRTNASFKTIPMILDKDNGFSNELSLFQLLKENNKINGAGSHLYIGTRQDLKFSQKDLLEKLELYPELKMELAKESFPILKGYMANNKDDGNDIDQKDDNDLNSLILKMAKGEVPVVEVKETSEENIPKGTKRSKNDIMDILDDMK